jgi:3-hydroxyisobutyrate dehydrogenase-like beta-hydroxyacid dehydrogenase
MNLQPTVISIVSAGAMGSALASRLTTSGCTVLTNLDGRSQATKERAKGSQMQDKPLHYLFTHSDIFLSVLPPNEALKLALKVFEISRDSPRDASKKSRPLIFVEANAVNPATVKKIDALFSTSSSISFIDACIIGGPPADGYDPTIYASAHSSNQADLQVVRGLSDCGLKIRLLQGEGADVGDASALKMSYAGISKGFTGLVTTMILAAYESSPATAKALLEELGHSQRAVLERITKSVPSMIPKAYRWVGEMEEIAGFVGNGEGEVYSGLAQTFRRVQHSVAEEDGGRDIQVLEGFVANAKVIIATACEE